MKLPAKAVFVAGTIFACASQAHAAIAVVGSSRAASCYRAAQHEHATFSNIQLCETALVEDALSSRDRVATYVNLGILFFYRGEYDLALIRLDRAARVDPDHPEVVLNKAIVLMRRDESGVEAVPLFDRAIALGTREPALAYYGRGLAHQLNGDLTAAYFDIQRAAQLAPDWDAPARDLSQFIVERREGSSL